MSAINFIPLWELSDQKKLVVAVAGVALAVGVLVFLFGGKSK